MKIPRNNRIWTLFVATFIIFAGVLFFTNSTYAFSNKFWQGNCSWYSLTCIYGGEGGVADDLINGTKKVAGDAIEGSVIFILKFILDVITWFLNLAVSFFRVSIDANATTEVLSNDAIYKTWGTIRDLCNLLFILILLFSAFATIFQASKYNYKNTLLWVVIMALLVNFSYPIALFIIDISNSLMYTLLKQIFNEAGTELITTTYFFGSDLAAILTPKNPTPASLVVSIIFVFILFLTILSLSLILIVRTIALGVIIIFSPLGFVGKIINKDGGWWDYLFKYAMAGPIIALVLLVATRLMAATVGEPGANTQDVSLIASAMKLSMPIIILWMGMGMAIKGIDGAGSVMGKIRGGGVNLAKKFGKGTWNATGIPGAVKDRYATFKKSGVLGSDRREEREAKLSGFLHKGKAGWKNAGEKIERKRLNKQMKEFEDDRLSITEAQNKLSSSDTVERRAAALYLSKKDKINKDNYSAAFKALEGDSELQEELKGKTKKDNNINFIIQHELKHGAKDENGNSLTRDQIYTKNLEGLSLENLAKQKGLHEDINSNQSLKNFIQSNVANDAAKHQKFFNELSTKNQTAYANANPNLAPRGYGTI